MSLVEVRAAQAYELLEPAAWATQHMGLLRIGRTTNLPAEEGGDDDDASRRAAARARNKPRRSPPPVGPPAQRRDGRRRRRARALVEMAGRRRRGRAEEDKCANLYVDCGLPLLDAPFAPAAPPPMSDDADELKEQADAPLADENVAHKAALEELKNAPRRRKRRRR